jgi:hypothetical protein
MQNCGKQLSGSSTLARPERGNTLMRWPRLMRNIQKPLSVKPPALTNTSSRNKTFSQKRETSPGSVTSA